MKAHRIRFRKQSSMLFSKIGTGIAERDRVKEGFTMRAIVHPKVREMSKNQFVEMADIELPNGEFWLDVMFEDFQFCDKDE